MSDVHNVEVAAGDDGMRLDRWFKSHYPGLGFGALQKLLRSGQVRLDGARVKAGTRVYEGQSVRVPPGATRAPAQKTQRTMVPAGDVEEVRAMVLHMDNAVIVLNKPAGLAVQGGSKTERHLDGLLDALTYRAPERPRLVHRLDRDTSGVLVLARSRAAATALTGAFKRRATEKIYWALVHGVPRPAEGSIDLALIKAGKAGDQRMAVCDKQREGAMSARTWFHTLDHAARKYAWLALSPLTGRTHQLRVHCTAIGHPVVGDGKYTDHNIEHDEALARQLHLHARAISIDHPDGGRLEVTAPLPPHMEETWGLLGFQENTEAARDPFIFRVFDE